MPRVLIVAYGNPLRGDDGVGWLVAEKLRRKLSSPEVEVVQLQQLLPELAENVGRAGAVIFVDASVEGEPGEVRCTPVVPAASAKTRFSHQLSPAEALGLAGELYGTRPLAFSVTVSGLSFDHGEEVSAVVSACLPQLESKVESLTNQILSGSPL